MKKQRLFIITLMLIFTLSLVLVGCGGNPNNTPPAGDNNNGDNQEQEQGQETDAIVTEDLLTFELSEDGTYYILSDMEVKPEKTILNVPATYNNLPVKEISSFALTGGYLTEVTIPSSVTNICDDALYENYELQKITLPYIPECIGYIFDGYDEYADKNDLPDNLKHITFTGGTTIGENAFIGCNKLESIDLPETITTIGENAFDKCIKLNKINIPNIDKWLKVEFFDIKSNPLFYAHNLYVNDQLLEELYISPSVETINPLALAGCRSINRVAVDTQNKTFHDDKNCIINTAENKVVFGNSNSTIPTDNSVTAIGKYAFAGCNDITTFTVPNNITVIEDYAFNHWDNLTEISLPLVFGKIGKIFDGYYEHFGTNHIPNSLTTIKITNGTNFNTSYTFENCENLVKVELPDTLTTILQGTFSKCKSLSTIKIPDSVDTLSQGAFYGCESLTNVVVPESVTFIGPNVFADCTNLETVRLPHNITEFSSYLFENCKKLTHVNIPESITKLNINAFNGCESISSITIPANVSEIDTYTYSGLKSDTFNKLEVLAENTKFKSEGNCIIETQYNYVVLGCNNSVIPDYITTIGENAFAGCTGLTNFTIPDSVMYIRSGAFENCTNLTTINFSNSLKEIDGFVFDGCTSLSSVTLPSSIQKIGSYLFKNCTNLTSISYNGYISSWNSVTKNSYWHGTIPASSVSCIDGNVNF